MDQFKNDWWRWRLGFGSAFLDEDFLVGGSGGPVVRGIRYRADQIGLAPSLVYRTPLLPWSPDSYLSHHHWYICVLDHLVVLIKRTYGLPHWDSSSLAAVIQIEYLAGRVCWTWLRTWQGEPRLCPPLPVRWRVSTGGGGGIVLESFVEDGFTIGRVVFELRSVY